MATDSLTYEQERFIKESETRNSVAKEILENPLSAKERAQIFWNEAKDRLHIGKYVHRVEITGDVGDVLQVRLNGNNLQEYLPHGVVFRGVRVGSDFKDDYTVPISGPFYNPYSKEISLPIDKEVGVDARTMDEIKNSGLVAVHEIGHAIDDVERPDRLDKVTELQTEEDIYRSISTTSLTWFSENHFRALRAGGNFNENQIREEIAEVVINKVQRDLAKEDKGQLKDTLEARNINIDKFVKKVCEETSIPVYRTYKNAAEIAMSENPESAVIFIKKTFKNYVDTTHNNYEETLSSESAKSERQAWAKGLEIARKMTKEHGTKFWDKSFKELNIFIDRLINAHGIDAGRKGVKNPITRKALYIP